ncbi:hypothetical protein A3C87_03080 [Candidatus Kaiserbacteria bacterium RIFCSPHIGHO2_02_FULL_49_34]|uniref:HYR domain-containing protein n=1 Tax=Candidatus Kaiserbacteria bacterium RIFCSPHIGHO2_02_FULL_49_34 TaxID=1798491 RepID=A0A1F6DI70_9BACT|nr:MAG: hypothetical protein A3C87_03080 [Candidatus Kaiserbacteria bacterium RIFCSPHIGHO2_02_FULL_49_34]
MNIISKITSGIAIALLTVSLALPGVVRADAWDWNYSYDYGSTGYDYGYGYGSTGYNTSYDYGSTGYNNTYDYGSTGYNTTYDYGSTGYNTTYDYGSTGYNTTYDYGSTGYNTTYDYGSTGYNTTYDYGSTDYNTTYDYGSTGWDYSYDYGSTDWNYEYDYGSNDWSYESPSYSYEPVSWNTGYSYAPVTYTYDWDYGNDWYYEPPTYVPPTTPTPPTYPAPVCSLSLSDTSITRGDAVTLSWGGANATRVVITDGNGETIVSTTDVSSSREIYPRTSTTFTMKAYNAAGAVDTCTKSITVTETAVSAPVCHLTISDSSITRGDSVKLTWNTSNATRVVITDDNGESIVSTSDTSGSRTVYPRTSTTFKMKAYNAKGDVDTCTKSITVERESTTSGSAPICDLRVSDRVVKRGMPVLLTWDNTRAKEMTIRDQYGNVIISADTNTSRSPNSGSQTVIPNQNVTYTMKVQNNNGSDTCSVSVDTTTVSGDISVDRVPLANVPYTGFDAGPTMTVLFYVLLGIWAVGIAYYVMQRKYGASLVAAVETPAAPVASVAHVSHAVATPVALPVANLPTDDNFEKMFGAVAEEPVFSLAQYAAQEHIFVTDEVIAAIQASAHTAFAQKAMFDALVAKARGTYPTEHGWLTIDSTRYATLNA